MKPSGYLKRVKTPARRQIYQNCFVPMLLGPRLKCVQTFGGFGFAEEYDVERKFEGRLYQVAPISTNLYSATSPSMCWCHDPISGKLTEALILVIFRRFSNLTCQNLVFIGKSDMAPPV